MIRPALLLFLLLGTQIPLQAEDQQSRERSFKGFFSSILEDQKTIWSAPFKETTWKKPGTYFFLGISAASFSLDGEPSRRLRESDHFEGFNDVMASDAADIVLAVLPAGLLAAGAFSGNSDFADYGFKAGEAALDAFIATSLLKAVTLRSRPHNEKTYGFWECGNSFPSGHAGVAWSLAAVTAKHYSKKKWVPWVVYPAAGLVAFSRVTSGNHYVSDAVVGSAIGFVIGYYVVD